MQQPPAAVVDLTGIPDDDTFPTFRVCIIGDPIPKPSSRHQVKVQPFRSHEKPKIKRWTRNPAEREMLNFRELSRQQLKTQSTVFPVVNAASKVFVNAWFCKRPPNTYFISDDRTRPKGALLDPHPFTPIMKPDTDNCVKFILDSLSKVAWMDDNQVAMITACKCLDYNPPFEGRTIIEFGVLDHVLDVPEWAKIVFSNP